LRIGDKQHNASVANRLHKWSWRKKRTKTPDNFLSR
jgi:hypothetical protein